MMWAPKAGSRVAFEGKGPQKWPQKSLDRRLEEVAKAVGGGYRRLQMPLKLALAIRETVHGHRLGTLEGGGLDKRPRYQEGGGGTSPPSNASLAGSPAKGQRRSPPARGTCPAGAGSASLTEPNRGCYGLGVPRLIGVVLRGTHT